jgi:membrane protein YqaA with SNARE-associated domain
MAANCFNQNSTHAPGHVYMKSRYLIPFLACISILILSEYFLLAEMYRDRRLPVILAAAGALLGSIFAFWLAYRRFRKASTAKA